MKARYRWCAALALSWPAAIPAHAFQPVQAPPAVAAPAAPPRPAIWLLEDEDTKIYLFGTYHVVPPGLEWRSATLNEIADRADELVVESYWAPDSVIDGELQALFLAEQSNPILERVPVDRREALRRAIEAGPIPIAAYDMMPSWVAAMMLGLSEWIGGMGWQDPSDMTGVETVLEAHFRSVGKPIGGVEDPNAIMRAMNALAPEVQSEMLLTAIESAGSVTAADADVRAWAAGETEAMEIGADDLPPALHEILIRSRNAAWTIWLKQRLERPGTILFAVGAGHLAGPDSVQRMLAAQGLEARRIE